jgi:ABC-type transport system involved in Fe-S cluster assembly fused permease/ATPase subunit
LQKYLKKASKRGNKATWQKPTAEVVIAEVAIVEGVMVVIVIIVVAVIVLIVAMLVVLVIVMVVEIVAENRRELPSLDTKAAVPYQAKNLSKACILRGFP